METFIETFEMPVGYRFAPTDEELIKHYLTNKVFYRPLPAKIIQEISASFIFSRPPSSLVGNACEKEWFFFIYQDEYFRGDIKRNRVVEDGTGFWRCIGEEEPVYNSKRDRVLASKIHLTYFSGSDEKKAKKTHWRMDEYRLRRYNKKEPEAEWILGRIVRGREYPDPF